MGNYSSKLSPQGHTSILVEFFCWHGDSIWNADTKELLDTSVEWLERIGFVKHGDVAGCYRGRERYAYPIYTLGYRKELAQVEGYLRNFINLYSIGRSSCFRYDTQDQAMGAGISAAWSIMSGTRHKETSRGCGTVV
jgi:protoporphyrinogen oxidase